MTRKALDGLFFMIAEEERAIRKDPLGQSSKILQSVFGALGGTRLAFRETRFGARHR